MGPRRLAPADNKMVIETVPIDSIKPHPQNPRIHNEKNLKAIMKSIQEFGQQVPVIVGSKGQIIKGCGTWEAMTRLEFSSIQIARAKGLTESQELAFALADNKTTDMSEFDFEKVADILQFLDGEGFDLEATGFEEFEIEPLLNTDWVPDSSPEIDTSKKYQLTFSVSQAEEIKRTIVIAKKNNRSFEEACDEEVIIHICKLFSSNIKLKTSKPRRIE